MSEPPDASQAVFSFRARKNGEVEISHHGRVVSTLRGRDATQFQARMARCTEAESQRLMAQATGNYKRGNEGSARTHPRRGG